MGFSGGIFSQLQYLGLSVLLRMNHILGFVGKVPCTWDILSLHLFLTWLLMQILWMLLMQILWILLGCHLLLEAFLKGLYTLSPV